MGKENYREDLSREIRDFPEKFQDHVLREASNFLKEKTPPLLRDMVRQHNLLQNLTGNWVFPQEEFDPIVAIIGTGQGLKNVHEAHYEATYNSRIRNHGDSSRVFFITTGAIGITTRQHERLGAPGVNAKVLATMLREYGVPNRQIIIDKKSMNTVEQAEEVAKICAARGFKKAFTILDIWHGPRFIMTMINKNPSLRLFSHYLGLDTYHIGGATFDWGDATMQYPLLISEIARLHYYVEENLGPVGIQGLKDYNQRNFYWNERLEEKFTEVQELWNKTHEDILKNARTLIAYREFTKSFHQV